MNRLFGVMMLAVISTGSTSLAFADTATISQPMPRAGVQQQCQVAQLQKQVNILTGEVAALQVQTEIPAASENVIDNLATGG